MVKKFENFNDEEETSLSICWGIDGINRIIKFYEEEIEEAENDMNSSSFPEGEQETITSSEACISLLREMRDEKSWMYRAYRFDKPIPRKR